MELIFPLVKDLLQGTMATYEHMWPDAFSLRRVGVGVRTSICIMANPSVACQGQWLRSSVRNGSNDLVFQGVKGLSNSISENICLCVLEPDSLYWWSSSSLNRSLAEARGRAANVFRSPFAEGVWVRRPFGQTEEYEMAFTGAKRNKP